MEIKARAKINLSLDVTGRRPDGYHLVKMVMQTIDLCDTLILERTEKPGISLTSDSGNVPAGSDNLIWKAADLMFRTYSLPGGISFYLEKRIPQAAGLAGGSTDAAAVFCGMNELYEIGASTEELQKLGVTLGADIPYCILGGTALSEGIGEILTPLPAMPSCTILLAKPEDSVSTPYAYRKLDEAGEFLHPDVDGQIQAIREGNLRVVAEKMGNVLETVTAAEHPSVTEIEKWMLEHGALGVRMSGSGPSVFGIYEDRTMAEKVCSELMNSGLAKDVFVTAPFSDRR